MPVNSELTLRFLILGSGPEALTGGLLTLMNLYYSFLVSQATVKLQMRRRGAVS